MTAQHRPARFAFNTIANWVQFLFTALVGFFLSPYLVAKLGATQYGVWTLMAGLVGYLGLLDLGIRQAVNRYTAHHHAAGTHAEGSLIISAALRLFSLLGVLAVLLAVALAYLAPTLFNIPPELTRDAQAIIVIGGATIAVSLVSGVYGGAVSGMERFDVQCGLDILVTALRTAAIVLALMAGHGLVALALIQLAASVLNAILFWLATHRLYPQLEVRLRGSLGPQMRTILRFSASLTVLFALGKIISYSDSVVIAAFLPIESVTYFAIAGSLVLYAKELVRSFSYVMTPRVSALTSVGSDQVGAVIVSVAKISTLASAPIAITFLVRGESFISMWMGAAYGPLSGEVLRILALVVWLDASRAVAVASLTGMAKQHLVIPGIVVEAASNLALSLALVVPLGIAGVALGTLIPSVVASLGYIPHCLRKACGVPAGRFLRESLLAPTLACVPFTIATVLVEYFLPARNLAVFFLQTFAVLALVPATAWMTCLSPAEKTRVREEFRRLRAR